MLSSRLAREAQALGSCALRCRSRLQLNLARRALSTTATTASASPSPSTSSIASPTPWFVDSEEEISPYARRSALPQAPTKPLAPLPAAIPSDHPIARLHAELKASPHLEPGTLLVREPIPTATGPPLPATMPKGRRQRGRSYVGEGVAGDTGGIWEWLVIAQVKEGTEDRGAIESVIRTVRKTLLTADPPTLLPLNNKRRFIGGWAMIDAGHFAVHILSKEAREKFFPDQRNW
ncbi:uncharacterized protein TRAVEDRAFT_146490 [Trametes versicolor FP-101664 SS1]|uniref:uncharacterized protein n=1 Tax=Trametes versicolor (strain FP-101664) TaxID=717944 RepID=UPI0004623398|nr:uncharacterized protein TRAVEDRAFT_146490 [Trametes versicolor FP-101664 SS1]EIW60827.1 hypothetical protein TRAVEDRAFT_146490 [Trametes versicolor FP-101664 SS1]